MKTVAQWAEQLPELIRIEFLKEAEKQKTDIDAVLDINYSGFSQSLFFHIAEIDKWFWYGLRDNEYVDPTSADYIDESVPYTKSEVDAMILEYADPNDEVCKVMLANVGKTKEATLANQLTYEALSLSNKNLIIEIGEITKENEALKSTIDGLANENAELISETQRLNHLVEAQKVEIENYKNERVDLVFHLANAKLEIGELKDKICGLSDDLINVENNNHELLEQIKPTPQPKTSLLQRFINWIL